VIPSINIYHIINANGTYLILILTDTITTTGGRFTPSGSVVYDAMTLKPVANGISKFLTVSGSVLVLTFRYKYRR
jgi:uncharacterized membrane protein